jgi:Fe-S cluster assembly iron-binding protein IscA
MDTDIPLQDQALNHVRELLSSHWREAKDSADDEGKFAIGLRVCVQNGSPAKLKVKCSISKTITDEIESQVDDPDQMKLL